MQTSGMASSLSHKVYVCGQCGAVWDDAPNCPTGCHPGFAELFDADLVAKSKWVSHCSGTCQQPTRLHTSYEVDNGLGTYCFWDRIYVTHYKPLMYGAIRKMNPNAFSCCTHDAPAPKASPTEGKTYELRIDFHEETVPMIYATGDYDSICLLINKFAGNMQPIRSFSFKVVE